MMVRFSTVFHFRAVTKAVALRRSLLGERSKRNMYNSTENMLQY